MSICIYTYMSICIYAYMYMYNMYIYLSNWMLLLQKPAISQWFPSKGCQSQNRDTRCLLHRSDRLIEACRWSSFRRFHRKVGYLLAFFLHVARDHVMHHGKCAEFQPNLPHQETPGILTGNVWKWLRENRGSWHRFLRACYFRGFIFWDTPLSSSL